MDDDDAEVDSDDVDEDCGGDDPLDNEQADGDDSPIQTAAKPPLIPNDSRLPLPLPDDGDDADDDEVECD